MPLNKVFPDAQSALKDVTDGMTLFCGGFGLAGTPEELILALRDLGPRQLTFVSNNAGTGANGLVHLLKNGQVKKMISSYVGENAIFEEQLLKGQNEVEVTPPGTLAGRVRAGGAGIPAVFTPAGVGTLVPRGKGVPPFDGPPAGVGGGTPEALYPQFFSDINPVIARLSTLPPSRPLRGRGVDARNRKVRAEGERVWTITTC